MKSCPANIVLIDKTGTDEIECKGKYYADGRLFCKIGTRELYYDPQYPYSKDPKRLLLIDTEKWSRFCVKSVILDPKHIRKLG